MRVHLVLACVLVLQGCATTQPPPQAVWPSVDRATLLSGELLFDSAVEELPGPPPDLLEMDDEMREFASVLKHRWEHDDERMRRLLKALRLKGLLDLNYDADQTLTAAQTFHTGEGNCLSFTNLFIALARALDLPARYQLVDVPTMTEREDDLLLVYKHINVLVIIPGGGRYEVDFNRDYGIGNHPRRGVSDAHAQALFDTNLAAEALKVGENRRAFSLLRRAIRTDPTAVAPWINLGVMFRRGGQYAAAETAYREALLLDPEDSSARYNLLGLYEHTKYAEPAGAIRAQLHAQQLKNPYYHFELAQRALSRKKWRESIPSVLEAIRLNPRDPRFYAALATAQSALGESRAAERNFARARRLAADPREIADYRIVPAAASTN